MYTVDLHPKGATVEDALYNLKIAIKQARGSKDKTLCLIVGYGSTGGTHKIKTNVLLELEELKKKNQIKDFILGSEVDIFSVKYQTLKGKELIDKECFKRRNPGEIIVIL